MSGRQVARKVERMQRVLFILLGGLAPVHLVEAAIRREDGEEELRDWILRYSHSRFPWASGIDVMDAAQQIAESWCDKKYEDADLPALTQSQPDDRTDRFLSEMTVHKTLDDVLAAIEARKQRRQSQPSSAGEVLKMADYLLEQAKWRMDEALRHPADSPTRIHFAAMAEADRDTAAELRILARQFAAQPPQPAPERLLQEWYAADREMEEVEAWMRTPPKPGEIRSGARLGAAMKRKWAAEDAIRAALATSPTPQPG